MPTVVELRDPGGGSSRKPPAQRPGACSAASRSLSSAIRPATVRFSSRYRVRCKPSRSVSTGSGPRRAARLQGGMVERRATRGRARRCSVAFLYHHERCLARRAGATSFAVVTTVPASDRERDARHPLPTSSAGLSSPLPIASSGCFTDRTSPSSRGRSMSEVRTHPSARRRTCSWSTTPGRQARTPRAPRSR